MFFPPLQASGRHASPSSPHRGRFFGKPLRTISRFSHQDAQTPPSPRVKERGRGEAHRVDVLASPCVPSPVSGSRTPKLPLLPVWEKGVGGMRGKRVPQRSGRHRGTTAFLALLLRLQASRRVRAGGARTQGISASSGRFFGKPLRAISRFRQQNAQTPPSPRVGEGGWGMRGPKRTGKLTYPFTAPPAAGTPVAVTAASAVWWV